MSGTKHGVDSPLYDCNECGDQTVIPEELAGDGVIGLECPTCGNETLTAVDNLCRFGRTISPHKSACYEEWSETWEKPNLAVRLCDAHYDHFTSTPPLPDGAVGRCESDECTHAVWEETESGNLICNACQNDNSGNVDSARSGGANIDE